MVGGRHKGGLAASKAKRPSPSRRRYTNVGISGAPPSTDPAIPQGMRGLFIRGLGGLREAARDGKLEIAAQGLGGEIVDRVRVDFRVRAIAQPLQRPTLFRTRPRQSSRRRSAGYGGSS